MSRCAIRNHPIAIGNSTISRQGSTTTCTAVTSWIISMFQPVPLGACILPAFDVILHTNPRHCQCVQTRKYNRATSLLCLGARDWRPAKDTAVLGRFMINEVCRAISTTIHSVLVYKTWIRLETDDKTNSVSRDEAAGLCHNGAVPNALCILVIDLQKSPGW